MSSRKASRFSAFTLIELLVVVAIIAILAGLLLPALTAAREQARRSACSNNLDQMAKAFEIYLGQYGDYYPGNCSWWAAKEMTPDKIAKWTASWGFDCRYSGDFSGRNGQSFSAINKTTGKWQTVWTNNQGRADYGQYSGAQFDPTCVGSATFGNGRFWPAADGAIDSQVSFFPGYNASLPGYFPASDNTNLKLAPVGLGWLLYTNALPDARAFYCPSATDQSFKPLPSDKRNTSYYEGGWQPYGNWEMGKHPRYDSKYCNTYWHTSGLEGAADTGTPSAVIEPFKPWGITPVDDTLRSWYAAGGTDADVLVHGNWGRRAAVVGTCGYQVFSQYMYRNQPVNVTHSNDRNSNSDDGTHGWQRWYYYNAIAPFTVPFTSPAVTTSPGCPAFKTPRQLGNHALVSDSWEKSTVISKPGFGAQAHKDGYNVLYGNYATRWYGDPAGTIMYWVGREGVDNEVEGWTNWYTVGLGSTTTLFMSGQKEVYGSEVNPGMLGHYASFDPLVWHTLDTAADVDTNANASLTDQRNGEPDPSLNPANWWSAKGSDDGSVIW